jgi:hypothetical protein
MGFIIRDCNNLYLWHNISEESMILVSTIAACKYRHLIEKFLFRYLLISSSFYYLRPKE